MAIVFSLIMGAILAFAVFLGVAFVWARFSPSPPDDIDALFAGDLFGVAAGLALSAALLWRLWPRSVAKRA
jgi:low affinity Fe/Cu permease